MHTPYIRIRQGSDGMVERPNAQEDKIILRWDKEDRSTVLIEAWASSSKKAINNVCVFVSRWLSCACILTIDKGRRATIKDRWKVGKAAGLVHITGRKHLA